LTFDHRYRQAITTGGYGIACHTRPGLTRCSCYYYHCDKITTVKLYRPNSRKFTNEKKSKNLREKEELAKSCIYMPLPAKYAKKYKIRFRIQFINNAKQILIKSIFLYDVAKKTCKCMKFTALLMTNELTR